MIKRGKKYKQAATLIEKNKVYSAQEACEFWEYAPRCVLQYLRRRGVPRARREGAGENDRALVQRRVLPRSLGQKRGWRGRALPRGVRGRAVLCAPFRRA